MKPSIKICWNLLFNHGFGIIDLSYNSIYLTILRCSFSFLKNGTK